jgi:hypothetical protein
MSHAREARPNPLYVNDLIQRRCTGARRRQNRCPRLLLDTAKRLHAPIHRQSGVRLCVLEIDGFSRVRRAIGRVFTRARRRQNRCPRLLLDTAKRLQAPIHRQSGVRLCVLEIDGFSRVRRAIGRVFTREA